jgi:lipid II:glycine glycyltransferase (peptidoglycan interpeptide bridge formation enzyme)
MYDLYECTKNYDPCLLGVISDDGEVLAVLLAVIQREYSNFMGGLTARAIIWGGPLVKDDDATILAFVLQKYEELVGDLAIYTQIRNLGDMSGLMYVFEEAEFVYEEHLNIIVDLSRPQEILWKEVHSKRRNEIRRARKEGTYVQELVRMSEVERMCGILDEVYHNARLPLADKSMFISAFKILKPIGWCRYFGAFHNHNLIGVICLLAYRKCLYDWYAGSMRGYLNKYPNDLLPWEVFKWGKENGYAKFDFGGAGKPNEDYGVRDYKKKFGGEFVNFGRFQKIHKPMTYLLAQAGYSAWRFIKGRTGFRIA